MQLQSASRGTLTLRSDDPLAAPLVDPNYLASEQDRRELKEAYMLVGDFVSQPALADHLGAPLEPEVTPSDESGVEDLIRETANPGYHFCGTCRLGDDADEMAVVTPDARVRGMDNLRVADASIMPSIVSANTNATAMMIGERVSELMLERPAAPAKATC